MSLTAEEVARAFSSHDFEATVPYIDESIVWNLLGGEPLIGRDAVVQACLETGAHLAGITTDFRTFRAIVGGTTVVVDSLAEYTQPDGTASVVASCDLYDFTAERLTSITSYTVEIKE